MGRPTISAIENHKDFELILLILGEYNQESHIAKYLSVSRSAICQRIKKLERARYINIERNMDKTNTNMLLVNWEKIFLDLAYVIDKHIQKTIEINKKMTKDLKNSAKILIKRNFTESSNENYKLLEQRKKLIQKKIEFFIKNHSDVLYNLLFNYLLLIFQMKDALKWKGVKRKGQVHRWRLPRKDIKTEFINNISLECALENFIFSFNLEKTSVIKNKKRQEILRQLVDISSDLKDLNQFKYPLGHLVNFIGSKYVQYTIK